jgi:hypothetical protein
MKHLALLLILTFRANAGSVLITDAFHAGPSDVIGNSLQFDAESVRVTVTGATLTLDIRTNFGNAALTSMWDHVRLDVGDVFFTVNGNYAYGIPLHYHNGPAGGPWGERLLAGHVYAIDNADQALMTARQVLHNDPWFSYRPDEIVWMMDNGGVRDVTAGKPSLQVSGLAGNDGINGPLWDILVTTSLPAGLFSSPVDQYGLHWAVSTGGNDIVNGALDFGFGGTQGAAAIVVAAPEPGTWYLVIGAVLVGVARLVRRVKG